MRSSRNAWRFVSSFESESLESEVEMLRLGSMSRFYESVLRGCFSYAPQYRMQNQPAIEEDVEELSTSSGFFAPRATREMPRRIFGIGKLPSAPRKNISPVRFAAGR